MFRDGTDQGQVAAPQPMASGVGSGPHPGNGAAGAAPPLKR